MIKNLSGHLLQKHFASVLFCEKLIRTYVIEFARDNRGDAQNATFSDLIWQMNQAFCATDSFYVASNEYGIVAIDKFIRRSNAGDRYYIGGILDYHI